MTADPDAGRPQAVAPLLDSPAFKAGLLPGDIILAVNGKSTEGLVHEDFMAFLRGDFGVVKIAIRRVEH